MITENLSTLKIHKLTQAQYDKALAAGNIDENALYLTPDEEIDLSGYVTEEHLNNVLEEIQTSDVSGQIETHNTSENAHSDIRGAISNLKTLVGDTSVSDQIITATQPYATKSYVDDQRIAHTEYVTILPETTLTFEEADVESGITLPEKLALKPNAIYLVNWNGVEYEYKSSDGETSVHLGNRTYHHPLNKRYDGYGPFRFQTYYDFSTDDSKVFVNSAGTYTVSISEVVFHQIDPRYYKQLAYVDYDVIYPAKIISVTETTTVTTPSNAERTCYWYQLLSADLAGWVSFNAEDTYLVNWNGTEYECKCNDLDDGIGDPYWFGDAEELTSGEPFFLFRSYDDEGLWVYTCDSGECTIEISEIIVHKIDEKYLPEMEASTLGGKTADDFASAEALAKLTVSTQGKFDEIESDLTNLSTIVGDTSIAEQISKMPILSYGESQDLDVTSRSIAKNNVGVYVGAENPADALEGDIWVDSDSDAFLSINYATAAHMVKKDNVITATLDLDNGESIVNKITLDSNGYPVSIVTDGIECVLTWEGFE